MRQKIWGIQRREKKDNTVSIHIASNSPIFFDITDRTMGDHQRKTNRKTRVGQKRTECPTENTPDKGFENVRATLQQRLGMAMGGMSEKSSSSGKTSVVSTSAREGNTTSLESRVAGKTQHLRSKTVPRAISTATPSCAGEDEEWDGGGGDISSQTTGGSSSKFTAAETWRFVESGGKWDDESIKLTLSTYVKQKMFPHLKFMQGRSMIEFSKDQRSVCGQILARLNVPAGMAKKFWERYSRKVECYLNSKRNDSATALKNAFFSKYKQNRQNR